LEEVGPVWKPLRSEIKLARWGQPAIPDLLEVLPFLQEVRALSMTGVTFNLSLEQASQLPRHLVRLNLDFTNYPDDVDLDPIQIALPSCATLEVLIFRWKHLGAAWTSCDAEFFGDTIFPNLRILYAGCFDCYYFDLAKYCPRLQGSDSLPLR
jgi:hypothetical protein